MMSDYFLTVPYLFWKPNNYQLFRPYTVQFNFKIIGTHHKTGEGVGATRQVTMAEGAVFIDQLTHVGEYEYSYKIITGELPFSDC